MNARPHLILAISLTVTACGTTAEEPTNPELPEVKASELQRSFVSGPSLECGISAGQLDCSLSVEDGFRVEMISVLIEGDDFLDEVAYLGDEEVALLTGGRTHVAALPDAAGSLDVQIHYTADALESPDGVQRVETSVRCRTELGNIHRTTCEAGDYERWNAYLVPDDDLATEWRERTYGTPSVQTTIVSEAEDDRLCFREYPRCEREGLVEHWSEVAADGEVPEAVRYAFMLPAESAHADVMITTNVMLDPAPIDGPGVYVVGADGSVVRH